MNKLTIYIERFASKKIIENIISLGLLKMATVLLPLAIIPHLIKTIGLDLVGLLAIVTSICAYFNTVIDYGFIYTGTREVAQNKLNKDKNTKTFYNITYCKIFLVFLSFVILYCLSLAIPFIKDNLLLLLLSLGNISILSLSPSWFFQGVEDMKKIAIGEMVSKILSFILIISFIRSEKDLLMIPVFYILGQTISLFIYIYYIRKYIYIFKFRSFCIFDIVNKLKDSWSMFINIIFPNLYNNYSYIALGYFSSLTAVGAYDIVRKVMNISEQAIGILSKVYFPVLSNNFSKFSAFIRILILASIFLIVFQILFSFFGIQYIEKKDINIDISLLYLQSIAPIIYGLMLAYGINFLGVKHRDRELRNITILTSIVGFGLVTIFTYYFAAFGALLGVLLTWSLRAIICMIVAQKSYYKEA